MTSSSDIVNKNTANATGDNKSDVWSFFTKSTVENIPYGTCVRLPVRKRSSACTAL